MFNVDYYSNLYRHQLKTAQNYNFDKIIKLNNEFRRLWQEHILWTRFTVIAIVNNTPDLEFVTNRLLQNPVDFGNLLSKYYDLSVSKKFEELLRDHLTIAAELVVSAVKGDTNNFNSINARWHQNAVDISRFMSEINPYWSYEDTKNMMFEHLRLLLEETTAIIEGNIAGGITFYDETQKQAYEMADMFRDGIINQFPNRFIDY